MWNKSSTIYAWLAAPLYQKIGTNTFLLCQTINRLELLVSLLALHLCWLYVICMFWIWFNCTNWLHWTQSVSRELHHPQECCEYVYLKCSWDSKRLTWSLLLCSQKADSIMCRFHLSLEGFLIIRKLLDILLQLWICIRLHYRQEQRFSHQGNIALLYLRPEQKSITAWDGSLQHTHAHTSVW